MAYETFLRGPDWQCESGPYINRRVTTPYLWPEGAESGSGTKDTLTDGEHPPLCIGTRADRFGPVGFVVSFDSDTDFAEVNVAPGFIAKAVIANITGYGGGAANAWSATLAAFARVWIDDSNDLAKGVTLSLSAANDGAAANPLCGIVWPDQDEWCDSGAGGGGTFAFPKSFSSGGATAYLTNCVMLWPSNED